MLTKHKNQGKKQPKPNNNRLTEERTRRSKRDTYRNNRNIKPILLAITQTIYKLLSCGQVLALE